MLPTPEALTASQSNRKLSPVTAHTHQAWPALASGPSSPMLPCNSHLPAEVNVTLSQMTGHSALPVSTPLRGTASGQQSTGLGNFIGHLCLVISGERLWFFRPQLYTHKVSLEEETAFGSRELVLPPGVSALMANRNRKRKCLPNQMGRQIQRKKWGSQCLLAKGIDGPFKGRNGWGSLCLSTEGTKGPITENTWFVGAVQAALWVRRGR